MGFVWIIDLKKLFFSMIGMEKTIYEKTEDVLHGHLQLAALVLGVQYAI